MSIKPLRTHYSMENPASVYDEEAMTALELAGRTTAKVNECVTVVNKATTDLAKAHKDLVESVPGIVSKDVQNHIENGGFDAQINEHLGNMDERLDNLILNGNENSAEVVDMRVGIHGYTHNNAGNALREEVSGAIMGNGGNCRMMRGSINAEGGDFYQDTDSRIVSTLVKRSEIVYLRGGEGSVPGEVQFRVFQYDKGLNYIGATDWLMFLNPDTLDNNTEYIRFVCAFREGGTIYPEDFYIPDFVCTVQDMEKNGYKKYTNIPFINASVNSAGEIVHYTNRIMSPVMSADFTMAMPAQDHSVLVACYDENMNWIRNTPFTENIVHDYDLTGGVAYVRFVVSKYGNVNIAPSDVLTVYTRDNSMAEEWNKNAPDFVHDMMDIAYSDIGLFAPNTVNHFTIASHLGFNALKGDVQMTGDGTLIMSHDDGYTLDGDGYITAFNPDEYTRWDDVTIAQVKGLSYADLSTYARKFNPGVCTFDEYVKICANNHKIAYVTLRDSNIPEVVGLVFDTLKKYDMVRRCMINSYTLKTLETVRLYSREVPVSLVMNYGTTPTTNHLAKVQSLGNSIITLFYFDGYSVGAEALTQLTNSSAVITNARNLGIVVHMAQICYTPQREKCVERGIKGFHLTTATLPYHQAIYQRRLSIKDGGLNYFKQTNVKLPDIAESGVPSVTLGDNYLDFDPGRDDVDYQFARLPAIVTVYSAENPDAKAFQVDGRVRIVHGGVDGEYIVNVCI